MVVICLTILSILFETFHTLSSHLYTIVSLISKMFQVATDGTDFAFFSCSFFRLSLHSRTLNLLMWELRAVEFIIYLFIFCWNCRMTALILCYHSLALCIFKVDTSASAICHLYWFIFFHWYIGMSTLWWIDFLISEVYMAQSTCRDHSVKLTDIKTDFNIFNHHLRKLLKKSQQILPYIRILRNESLQGSFWSREINKS